MEQPIEPHVQFYLFMRGMLAWSITMSVLGLVGIPWTYLAYKIWHGSKPIDEEMSEELWTRSWYASWAIAVVSVVFLMFDFVTIDQLELPAGPIHIIYFLGFLGLVAWMMVFFFSMDDYFSGLNLTVVYLYVPTAVLFLLWLLTRWNPLFAYVLSWLKEPTA